MKELLLVRYGEIFLKGLNRPYFIRSLVRKIRYALRGMGTQVWVHDGRIFVDGIEDMDLVIEKVTHVFGVHSVCPAVEMPKDDLLVAKAFYNRFRNSDNSKIKIEVRSALKTLAEEGMICYWPEWFCALRDSSNPGEQLAAEEWRQKIIQEKGWDKEVLQFYGIDGDNETVD